MLKLRDYQEDLVERLRNALRQKSRRIVIVSPTGSGKTIIFSYLVSRLSKQGKRVLLITHRRELLMQSNGAFAQFDIDAEYIVAGNTSIPTGNVFIAMVETINRRLNDREHYREFLNSIDVIIIDEMHLGNFDKLFKFFSHQLILGFTATAYRRSPQKPLKDYYEKIIIGLSVKELIKKGYLVPSIVFGRKLDMQGIKTKQGDYDAKDQEEAFHAQQMFSSVIKHYNQYLKDKTTLAFCPSVDVSTELVRRFNESGIPSAHIDGTTPSAQRKHDFELFHKGDIKLISNVGVATTGFDEPRVEGIIQFLATKSLVKHIQILGRGSRIYPKKKRFIVLDYGNNANRLGFYEDDREWSLELDTRKFRKEPTMTKVCPDCNAILPVMTRTCSHCGHIFGGEQIREVIRKEIDIELQPLKNYESILEFIDGKSFIELDLVAELKGYSKNWVFHQISTYEDLKAYGEYRGFNKSWAHWMVEKNGWKPKNLDEKKNEYQEWRRTAH